MKISIVVGVDGNKVPDYVKLFKEQAPEKFRAFDVRQNEIAREVDGHYASRLKKFGSGQVQPLVVVTLESDMSSDQISGADIEEFRGFLVERGLGRDWSFNGTPMGNGAFYVDVTEYEPRLGAKL